MSRGLEYGTPFSVSVTHATSAVASKAAVATLHHFITHIAGSSDKAGALVLVKSGTTVIWQVQIATTAAGINAFEQDFSAMPLGGVLGELVSVTVDGTAACYANINGYSL